MRATRMVAWAWLVVVLAGCSTSVGPDESSRMPQPAPAETAPPPVGADVPTGTDAGPTGTDAQPGAAAGKTQLDGSVPDSTGSDSARSDSARPGYARPGYAQPLAPALQPVSASPRQVVRDATVELRVDDLAQATERARLIGPSHGGFVATEESAAESASEAGSGVSSLTLRVASTELDAALAALAALGEVTTRRLVTQDVTEQTIDLDARINSQRASVERVRALLDRANTIGEVVQVESELTWRQAELDSLRQRAAALADQVALSTIRVRLVGPQSEPAAAAGTGGFGSGLAAGWAALLVSARVLLRVLGAVLPFAAVLSVPVGAALLWYRRRRRTARAATATGE